MIEAALAIYLWTQQPSATLIQEVRRYRVYKRKKPQMRGLLPRVEIIPVRLDNSTFEQEWQYRVCIGTLATEIDTCSW